MSKYWGIGEEEDHIPPSYPTKIPKQRLEPKSARIKSQKEKTHPLYKCQVQEQVVHHQWQVRFITYAHNSIGATNQRLQAGNRLRRFSASIVQTDMEAVKSPKTRNNT